MTAITPTQKFILKAAANREDGAIHPLPDNLKGAAAKKTIESLKVKNLAGHGGFPDGDADLPILITDAGRAAISSDHQNQEPADDTFQEDVIIAEQALGIEIQVDEKSATTDLAVEKSTNPDVLEFPGNDQPKSKPKQKTKKRGITLKPDTTKKTATESKPSNTRKNSKQAMVIELLRRPEGATVEQIATLTGWQQHSVRGSISGAIKKRLGMTVLSQKNDQGTRVYNIPVA